MSGSSKIVAVRFGDEVLSGLVRDQLARVPGLVLSDETPDLVLAQDDTGVPVPHLILGAGSRGDHPVMKLPLRLGELTDRVLYLLSGRDRFTADGEISFAGFLLKEGDGTISDRDGRSVRLTEKEKLVLMSLHEADNRALDRASLLDLVWGYAETAETHTLETHLYRLRQKIEDNFGVKDLIVTRDGIYTLKS